MAHPHPGRAPPKTDRFAKEWALSFPCCKVGYLALAAALARMPTIHSPITHQAIAIAAVTFPDPCNLGSASSSFFAFDAFTNAAGARKIPKQKIDTIAYVRASFARGHGIVGSSSTTGCPLIAITLHDPQYFCPSTSTRQSGQNGSAHPAQRSTAVTSAWFLHCIRHLFCELPTWMLPPGGDHSFFVRRPNSHFSSPHPLVNLRRHELPQPPQFVGRQLLSLGPRVDRIQVNTQMRRNFFNR